MELHEVSSNWVLKGAFILGLFRTLPHGVCNLFSVIQLSKKSSLMFSSSTFKSQKTLKSWSEKPSHHHGPYTVRTTLCSPDLSYQSLPETLSSQEG